MPRVILTIALTVTIAAAVAQRRARDMTLYLDGDPSANTKLISVCRQNGPKYGIRFKFVEDPKENFDYRVVSSSDTTSFWNWAQGSLVVMDPDAKVLFTVTRSGRTTARGALNAAGKELVKRFARYLETHR